MKAATVSTRCMLSTRGSPRRRARYAHLRLRAESERASHAGAPRLSYVEQPALPGRDQVHAGVSSRLRVLHVDADGAAAAALAGLIGFEAELVHAATIGHARRLLASNVFSLLVLDPTLPDGDPRTLLPLLSGTPLLVYGAYQPDWRGAVAEFLPKQSATARQLWSTISIMLGLSAGVSAGA